MDSCPFHVGQHVRHTLIPNVEGPILAMDRAHRDRAWWVKVGCGWYLASLCEAG